MDEGVQGRPPAPGSFAWRQSPLPPLRFGRAGQDDRLSVLYFVKCLPDDYIGVVSPSQDRLKSKKGEPAGPEVKFAHKMVIRSKNDAPFHMSLCWDEACESLLLFFRFDQPGCSDPPDCSQWGINVEKHPSEPILSVALLTPFNRNRNGQADGWPQSHPYRLFCHSILHTAHRASIDACVLDSIPQAMYTRLITRQLRDRMRVDLKTMLEERCKGSVKIYLSKERDSLMAPWPESEDLSIFGLTHVLPWAIYLLEMCSPNCLMSDATFKFFRPYILEILHVIVRNESMPIAFAVFPTETGQSYLRMYRHVLEVLKKRKKPADLLTKLPFMSDRGSGLTKFISELKEEDGLLLWWFLCHRHLIENAGASSLAGDWVRLLLQCCTDSECIEAAQTILMEFDKLTEQQKVEFSKPENHHLLKSMLAAVKMEMAPSLQFSWEQPEVDPFESKFWARWVRNGCPTTTNAAESIHRWLNEIAETFGKTGFSGRYIKLVRYLQDRFDNRNSPTRKNERSTVRLMKKINGLKPPLSDADQALLDFNLKLHGSNGNPWVLGQDEHWEFPPWNAETQGFKEFLTETCTDEVPRSWKPERTDDISIAEAQSLRLFDLDMPDDSDLIPSAEVDGPSSAEEPRSINPDTPVSRVYLDNAWKIIRCVRRLMSEREWTRQGTWKIVIDTVHRCGADYRSREALTLDEKVEWKFGVFKELHLRFHV